jgi:hypothetical protein
MWDAKRQLIWLATGFILGTFVLYHDAFDEETGRFSLSFFLFLELLLILILTVMSYLYARKDKG